MKNETVKTLVAGSTYKVRVRYWDFDSNTHKPGKTVRRRFVGTETRFGSIPCAVFTSAIRKGRSTSGVLSVPHYDLLLCELA